MIVDEDHASAISEEEESGSSSLTVSKHIAAICKRRGIAFKDTTLENEGKVSVRFSTKPRPGSAKQSPSSSKTKKSG